MPTILLPCSSSGGISLVASFVAVDSQCVQKILVLKIRFLRNKICWRKLTVYLKDATKSTRTGPDVDLLISIYDERMPSSCSDARSTPVRIREKNSLPDPGNASHHVLSRETTIEDLRKVEHDPSVTRRPFSNSFWDLKKRAVNTEHRELHPAESAPRHAVQHHRHRRLFVPGGEP